MISFSSILKFSFKNFQHFRNFFSWTSCFLASNTFEGWISIFLMFMYRSMCTMKKIRSFLIVYNIGIYMNIHIFYILFSYLCENPYNMGILYVLFCLYHYVESAWVGSWCLFCLLDASKKKSSKLPCFSFMTWKGFYSFYIKVLHLTS